jgi:hypothetical protein
VSAVISGALVACGGTRLSTLDANLALNVERDCEVQVTLSDAGPRRSLAQACVCGARGVLIHAGQPHDDAGACP